jgi:hypothetical protein
MNCHEAREKFPEYFFSGVKDHPEALRAHLAACPACTDEAERLRLLWTKLGWIPDQAPSPALRAGFEAVLAGYRRGLEAAGEAAPAARWTSLVTGWYQAFLRRPVLQAALAMALVAVGVLAGARLLARPAPAGADPAVVALREEIGRLRQSMALSLLEQQSPSERLRGVSWTRRVGSPSPEIIAALLRALRFDPNVNVRLATLEVLKSFGDQQPVRDGLLEALTEKSSARATPSGEPLVKISLIDSLVDLRERQALDVIRAVAEDQEAHPAVRQRAAKAAQELASRQTH